MRALAFALVLVLGTPVATSAEETAPAGPGMYNPRAVLTLSRIKDVPPVQPSIGHVSEPRF